MTLLERIGWAAFVMLLSLALPTLLQLRVELRGWNHEIPEAIHSVVDKWLLKSDGLWSITIACCVPFAILTAGFLNGSNWYSRRTTIRYIILGLAAILVIWVPGGIHHLKENFSADAPPFAFFAFAGLSVIPAILLPMASPALFAILGYYDKWSPSQRSN